MGLEAKEVLQSPKNIKCHDAMNKNLFKTLSKRMESGSIEIFFFSPIVKNFHNLYDLSVSRGVQRERERKRAVEKGLRR